MLWVVWLGRARARDPGPRPAGGGAVGGVGAAGAAGHRRGAGGGAAPRQRHGATAQRHHAGPGRLHPGPAPGLWGPLEVRSDSERTWGLFVSLDKPYGVWNGGMLIRNIFVQHHTCHAQAHTLK